MKTTSIAMVFGAGVLAGCMAGSVPAPAGPEGDAAPRAGAPASASVGMPLLIDRMDLRIGTTVQFDRLPTVGELNDLQQLPGLAHVVVSLPEWPRDYEPLQPLDQIPYGSDLVVILPGFPPTHGAAEIWGYVHASLRVVVVVNGPPAGREVLNDLNSMRSLERVIAQMDQPSRAGFEPLQRPLSFRKIMS